VDPFLIILAVGANGDRLQGRRIQGFPFFSQDVSARVQLFFFPMGLLNTSPLFSESANTPVTKLGRKGNFLATVAKRIGSTSSEFHFMVGFIPPAGKRFFPVRRFFPRLISKEFPNRASSPPFPLTQVVVVVFLFFLL